MEDYTEVAQVCTSLLAELHHFTNFLQDCKSKIREYDRRQRQRDCQDSEEELDDPTHDPKESSGEESDSSQGDEDDEDVSPKEEIPRATTKAVKRTSTPQSSVPKPSVKRQKVSADSRAATEEATVKEETKGEGKRSHHAKRICPVCNKQEGNLRRHLQSHARKGLIEESAVETILSVAVRKGKRRGPRRKTEGAVRKGLRMEWCPFPGCDFVTHNPRSHLTHKHRLKQGTLLEQCTNMAKVYAGQQEVEEVKSYIHTHKRKTKHRLGTSSTATATSSATSTITATSHTTSTSSGERSPARYAATPALRVRIRPLTTSTSTITATSSTVD